MQRYAPVGKCIYCGATEGLSDEHIIPFGLNGDWVLPSASCKTCSAITSKFELDVLRGPLLSARLGLGLKSRRPRQQPSRLPLTVRRDGNEVVEQVPISENLNNVLLPIFGPPGFLSASPCKSGIAVAGWYDAQYNRSPEDVQRQLKADSIALELSYPIIEFARMLAKIAYGYAIAMCGLEAIPRPLPLSAILGNSEDIGCWVGTARETAESPKPDSLHVAQLHRNGDMMMVRLSLFAMQPTPVYSILLQGGDAEEPESKRGAPKP